MRPMRTLVVPLAAIAVAGMSSAGAPGYPMVLGSHEIFVAVVSHRASSVRGFRHTYAALIITVLHAAPFGQRQRDRPSPLAERRPADPQRRRDVGDP
jgi:hypothetical protein